MAFTGRFSSFSRLNRFKSSSPYPLIHSQQRYVSIETITEELINFDPASFHIAKERESKRKKEE